MRPAPKAPASSLVGHLFNRGGLAMKHKCALLCIALALTLMAVLATPAFALVPDGSQGWFWQMPQPAGGFAGLSALAFPDAGNLWTVGAGGLILHSTDAGATWGSAHGYRRQPLVGEFPQRSRRVGLRRIGDGGRRRDRGHDRRRRQLAQ